MVTSSVLVKRLIEARLHRQWLIKIRIVSCLNRNTIFSVFSTIFNQRMAPSYCPCGSRLDRLSNSRPCNSISLRIFVSIRTMGEVSSDSRVCGSCRGQFYSWKDKNPDLEGLLFSLDEVNGSEDEREVSSTVRLQSLKHHSLHN